MFSCSVIPCVFKVIAITSLPYDSIRLTSDSRDGITASTCSHPSKYFLFGECCKIIPSAFAEIKNSEPHGPEGFLKAA